MNILIIGSGGREHTLAWKLKTKQGLWKIHSLHPQRWHCPVGTNLDVSINDFTLKSAALKHKIDLWLWSGPWRADSLMDCWFLGKIKRQTILCHWPVAEGIAIEGSAKLLQNPSCRSTEFPPSLKPKNLLQIIMMKGNFYKKAIRYR